MTGATNKEDLDILLNAPVGKVKETLDSILGFRSSLVVTEQGSISGSEFTRKVVISAKGMPLVKADVRFDSSILPKAVLEELLKMKDGVGTILEKNVVFAKRKNLSKKHSEDKKSIIRSYEITIGGKYNDRADENDVEKEEVTWFFITEQIHLDFIEACKNG